MGGGGHRRHRRGPRTRPRARTVARGVAGRDPPCEPTAGRTPSGGAAAARICRRIDPRCDQSAPPAAGAAGDTRGCGAAVEGGIADAGRALCRARPRRIAAVHGHRGRQSEHRRRRLRHRIRLSERRALSHVSRRGRSAAPGAGVARAQLRLAGVFVPQLQLRGLPDHARRHDVVRRRACSERADAVCGRRARTGAVDRRGARVGQRLRRARRPVAARTRVHVGRRAAC